MMRIGIQAWGTEGDVRPLIALAGGLQAKGHQVTLGVTEISNKDFTPYSEKLNFSIQHVGKIDYNEKQLEEGLLVNVERLLLEFGSDFSLAGRQRKVIIDQAIHTIDLEFYHRGIPCIILADLKKGKFNLHRPFEDGSGVSTASPSSSSLQTNSGSTIIATKISAIVPIPAGVLRNMDTLPRYGTLNTTIPVISSMVRFPGSLA